MSGSGSWKLIFDFHDMTEPIGLNKRITCQTKKSQPMTCKDNLWKNDWNTNQWRYSIKILETIVQLTLRRIETFKEKFSVPELVFTQSVQLTYVGSLEKFLLGRSLKIGRYLWTWKTDQLAYSNWCHFWTQFLVGIFQIYHPSCYLDSHLSNRTIFCTLISTSI